MIRDLFGKVRFGARRWWHRLIEVNAPERGCAHVSAVVQNGITLSSGAANGLTLTAAAQNGLTLSAASANSLTSSAAPANSVTLSLEAC